MISKVSDDDLQIELIKFMKERESLLIPRDDLFGTLKGIEKLLHSNLPDSIQPFVDDYDMYVFSLKRYFYDSAELEGASLATNCFQQVCYALRIDYDTLRKVEVSNEQEHLEVDKAIVLLSAALASMQAARQRVSEKYAHLSGLLEAR